LTAGVLLNIGLNHSCIFFLASAVFATVDSGDTVTHFAIAAALPVVCDADTTPVFAGLSPYIF
jgi:hypothetical protein